MKRFAAELMLLSVALIWGLGFAFTQWAIDAGLTTLQILSIRFFLGTALLGAVFRRKLRAATPRALLAGFGLGALLFLGFVLQTLGLRYTTPSKNAFLSSVGVILVPFLCRLLFGQRISPRAVLCALVCVAGVYLLTSAESLSLGLGDALTLGCAVFFALQTVCSGRAVRVFDATVITVAQLAAAFVLSFAAMLCLDGFPRLTPLGAVSTAYLGVFSTSAAFLLQSFALQRTTQTRAAILLMLESVFGTLISVWLLGDSLTPLMALGCACIASAIVLSETQRAPRPPQNQ